MAWPKEKASHIVISESSNATVQPLNGETYWLIILLTQPHTHRDFNHLFRACFIDGQQRMFRLEKRFRHNNIERKKVNEIKQHQNQNRKKKKELKKIEIMHNSEGNLNIELVYSEP